MMNYKEKLEKSIQQADEGKLICFTMDELESIEDMETDKAIDFLENKRDFVCSQSL